jgi:plasmid stabilization system protein ParE
MLTPCHGLDSLLSSTKSLRRGSKPRLHSRERLSRCLQRKRLPRQWPISKRGRRTKPPTRSTSTPARPFRWRQWRIGSGAGVRRTNCRLPRRASPLPDTARTDMERLRRFLEPHGASLSERAVDTLFAAARSLADQPEHGRPAARPGYRELIVPFGARAYHPISQRSPPQRGRDYAAVARARATRLDAGCNDRAVRQDRRS